MKGVEEGWECPRARVVCHGERRRRLQGSCWCCSLPGYIAPPAAEGHGGGARPSGALLERYLVSSRSVCIDRASEAPDGMRARFHFSLGSRRPCPFPSPFLLKQISPSFLPHHHHLPEAETSLTQQKPLYPGLEYLASFHTPSLLLAQLGPSPSLPSLSLLSQASPA